MPGRPTERFYETSRRLPIFVAVFALLALADVLLLGGLPSVEFAVLWAAKDAALAALIAEVVSQQRQETARLKQELTRLATYDQTTSLLNGKAFAATVERRKAASEAVGQTGALLLIQLENLGEINRNHGFDWGDEALRLTAAAIRSAVRHDDFVGRLAGGDFGVFLWRASVQDAHEVGRRVQNSVRQVFFAPRGMDPAELKVTIGGVVASPALGFRDMLLMADRTRVDAKGGATVQISTQVQPSPLN